MSERRKSGVHLMDAGADGVVRDNARGDGEGGIIYVSMLDPIGVPSFKPSPGKPVPRCMQLAVRREDEGVMFGLGQVVEMIETPDTQSDESSGASTIRPLAEKEDGGEKQRLARRSSISSDVSLRSRRSIRLRGASYVSAEPLRLPSSQLPGRFNVEANLSSSTITTYDTPPEYPSPTLSAQTQIQEEGLEPSISETPTDQSRTTHTNSVRLPTKGHRPSGTANLLRRFSKGPRSVYSPKGSPSRQSSLRPSQSSTPLTSTEYIERYRPGKAASISGSPSSTLVRGEPFPLRRDGALKGRIVAKLHKAGPSPGPG